MREFNDELITSKVPYVYSPRLTVRTKGFLANGCLETWMDSPASHIRLDLVSAKDAEFTSADCKKNEDMGLGICSELERV